MISNATLQVVANTEKDDLGQSFVDPPLPAHRGLFVELWRRVRTLHLNVSARVALHRVVVYCTHLQITSSRLESIVIPDWHTWERSHRSLQLVFPSSDPTLLVTATSLPLAAAQQEVNHLLHDITIATKEIEQTTAEENLIKALDSAYAAGARPTRKRKHQKPISELSGRYQRKVAKDLTEELKTRFNDSIDNIILTLMTMNRTAAVKIALQLEGIDAVLSERILSAVKFTTKEMVDIMVYKMCWVLSNQKQDKGYISYPQLRIMREIHPTLFPGEAEIMKEQHAQNQQGIAVESGAMPVGDKQVDYAYCDFEKKVKSNILLLIC